MNEKRLLFWLTEIADEYVLEAVEHFRTAQRRPRRRLSRLLVIAAVFAALVAVAAVAYGISISRQVEKQAEEGNETASSIQIAEGVSIEMFYSVREEETLQEVRFSVTVEDPELFRVLVETELELRCEKAMVLGGRSGSEQDMNKIHWNLDMVLTKNVKPGDSYPVEVWVSHPERWVPADDPAAEPVEVLPPTGNWIQQPICLGILEVTVTSLYSGTVDFGDSLPVPLECGTAYVSSADIRSEYIQWNISLPKAFPRYPYLADPNDNDFPALMEELAQVLEKNALCFSDGSSLPLAVGNWVTIGGDGMTAHLTCYYHDAEGGLLQKAADVTGVAVGDKLYPADQLYDPDAVGVVPVYESFIP